MHKPAPIDMKCLQKVKTLIRLSHCSASIGQIDSSRVSILLKYINIFFTFLRMHSNSCFMVDSFWGLIIINLIMVSQVMASPQGAIPEACHNMTPSHGVEPQSSTPPFITLLEKVTKTYKIFLILMACSCI